MPPFAYTDAEAEAALIKLRVQCLLANCRRIERQQKEAHYHIAHLLHLVKQLPQIEEQQAEQKAEAESETVTMSSEHQGNGSNKRRKLSPEVEASTTDSAPTEQPSTTPSDSQPEAEANPPAAATAPNDTAQADRAARFAALKNRATQSQRSNLEAAKTEAQRSALDPSVLNNLNRKAQIAQHNLLKADTEEDSGTGAFERKRAWDYTIEESEKWDARMEAKKSRRDNNAFGDWSKEAGKVYERQVRDMEKIASSGAKGEGGGMGGKKGGKLREEYEDGKRNQIEAAASNGDLEIVELSTGELVAIDTAGRFYTHSSSASDNAFTQSVPRKENIDRLVQDLQKADEQRMAKRKKRLGEQADGKEDVTFINEKNKQFNLKLGRFYDRYTTEIRESFERGSAL
jgi:pre-mRNA-splicing factor SYF2